MESTALQYAFMEDGRIYDMARATLEHNIALKRFNKKLDRAIDGLKKDSNCNCEVFCEQSFKWPQDIAPYRIPDISVVCGDMISSNGHDLENVPVFIAEFLSPKTKKTDRGEKMELYATIGVPEYWLVEPVKRFIERYVLRDGRYALVDTVEGNGRIAFLTNEKIALDIRDLYWVR